MRALALLLPLLVAPAPLAPELRAEHVEVRGMTISCRTWGREWGEEGLDRELDELAGLGANWIAIHPYARIGADGALSWRALDPADPPEWIARPIRSAHARGLAILIKPHLAYWGSPFAWRGAIRFDDPAALERFFESYEAWLLALVDAARGADAFSVGCELEGLVQHEGRWRGLIARVRERGAARLTWAANWDGVERVRFWDALDAIGVQAYFPLSEAADPSEEELRAAWAPWLAELRALSARTGKPVVFTELGYSASLDAARAPWSGGATHGPGRARAERLQARCLSVALETLARERAWLRGAFLWKWFVGPAPGEDYALDRGPAREALAGAWRR